MLHTVVYYYSSHKHYLNFYGLIYTRFIPSSLRVLRRILFAGRDSSSSWRLRFTDPGEVRTGVLAVKKAYVWACKHTINSSKCFISVNLLFCTIYLLHYTTQTHHTPKIHIQHLIHSPSFFSMFLSSFSCCWSSCWFCFILGLCR